MSPQEKKLEYHILVPEELAEEARKLIEGDEDV
jgi:hypothetical protein